MNEIYIRSKDKMQIARLNSIEFSPCREFNFQEGKSKPIDKGAIIVNDNNFGEYTQRNAEIILKDIERFIEESEGTVLYKLPNWD